MIDSAVGEGCRVAALLRPSRREIGDRCQVGPFAYLRPGPSSSRERRRARSSRSRTRGSARGRRSRTSPTSATRTSALGANLGAGTITANYDGFAKNRTKIGEDARIAVNTSLVAPVSVGDGAYTGADAVIREDVPDGALAVSDNEQRNIDGYAEKKRKANEDTRPVEGDYGIVAILEESPQIVSSIPQDYTKRLMVFGGRASMELAARIAKHLDVQLGDADLRTFADGEVYCRYKDSIRGADVFLVQSTAANGRRR